MHLLRYPRLSLVYNTVQNKTSDAQHTRCRWWTNFWQALFMYNNIFLKKTFSPNLYASFGTFCVQISQLFEAEWVFKLSKEFEIDDIFLRKQKFLDVQASIIQRLTVPRIIDQLGRKRCQKKRKDGCYILLWEVFQKVYVVHNLQVVKY